MEKFTKQSYEKFTISADFSLNISDTETIVSQTVEAIDKDSLDSAAIVTDQTSIGNNGDGSVHIIVQAGDEELSPYKITFKCVTSSGHQWELDVEMRVEEI